MTQRKPSLVTELKKESVRNVARAKQNRREFVTGIKALSPVLAKLEKIGASAYVSYSDINVNLSGDAAMLASAVKVLREAGYKFEHKPAEGGYWCSYFRKDGALTLWVSFASTICTRVQVGTKMVEQPVYEMRCAGPDISVEEAVTL